MGITMTNISTGLHQQATGWVLGWSVGVGSGPRHDAVDIGAATDLTAWKRWHELCAVACGAPGDTIADRRDALEAQLTTAEKASGWDTLSTAERNALVRALAQGTFG